MLNKKWISFNNIAPGDSRAMLSQSEQQYLSDEEMDTIRSLTVTTSSHR